MKRFASIVFALMMGGSYLFATPVFSVQSGGIAITGQNTGTAGTSAAPWTINETMTAVGIVALTDTDGTPLVPNPSGLLDDFSSGSFFTKTVLNNSGVAWTSFEMELQQIIGTPSSEGDGLSFAQGAGLTFTSSVFTGYTRIDGTRDYLNFSGGTVLNGQSVVFTFAITDNSPTTPIYLLQTPNKSDVVPEPASMLLLGSGLLIVSLIRRKKIAG